MVDELDSGIYEYLLGECLEVMQDKAKGQLIFTSHNLRPLEILENDSETNIYEMELAMRRARRQY